MAINNLIPTAKYFWLTVKHKYFVYKAGRRAGVNRWQLLIHDLSKFGTKELPHYGRQFFGDKSDPEGFAEAWLHHQNVNPHHWEYWIPRTGHIRDSADIVGSKAMPMPLKYAEEMVADWMGACRAYEGHWPTSVKDWIWLQNNKSKMDLHVITKLRLNLTFRRVFNDVDVPFPEAYQIL